MNAYIAAIDYFLPAKVETMDDLLRENPDWPIDNLAAKAGVESRHIAAADETSCDLGYGAATKLLAREIIPKGEIDFLISCSQTPDHYLPTNACLLQGRLGLSKDVGTLEVSVGCTGYIMGLFTAKALIQSGMAKNVLLITSDTISKLVNPQDRALRVLFGDASAATLVRAGEGPAGLGEFVIGTNGANASQLVVPAGGFRMRCTEDTGRNEVGEDGTIRSKENLYMDGPGIFTFAIMTVPRLLKKLCQKSGRNMDQFDAFVFHQANEFMLKELAKRCGISDDKMVICLKDVGNTSCVSIPIALQRQVEAGKLQPGMNVALAGFGVGLSWGACEIVWG